MQRHHVLIGAVVTVLLLVTGLAYAQGTASGRDTTTQAALGPAGFDELTTSFTYQGRLSDGGSPANGKYDFEFALYDAHSDGTLLDTVTARDVTVTDGLFTVELDFGAGVFTGDARWLEIGVRPGASSGAYTPLSPRQALTATPYALYAQRVAEHDHLGQTWTGSDNPLVMNGSFGPPDDAPLVLSNSHSSGDGLRVNSAGDAGVYVASAGGRGVSVGIVGSPSGANITDAKDGLAVAGAEGNGLYVGQADRDGVFVGGAGDDGVSVGGAKDDGLSVFKAGNPSTTSASTDHNGLEVAGAEGNGVHIGQADKAGVSVYSAGDPTTWGYSVSPDGLRVNGAEGEGVFVGRADSNGMYVWSAGEDGVYVDSAGSDGVSVGWAGSDGVSVGSAGDDGVHVASAGSPSTVSASTDHNGLEVAGAEGDGLYIGQADSNGVNVHSAGANGVSVSSAGDDGIYVYSAGSPSRVSTSTDPNGFEVGGAERNGLYVGYAGFSGVMVDRAHMNGVYVDYASYGLFVASADYGVYVQGAGNYAGYFWGDVHVNGNITQGGQFSKIDHPLDPQNQYLYHSSVESPDMMNVYNGNVKLDAQGEAWVELPSWFETLNRDFRYQLTCIGGFAPVYVAQEIQNNRFQIAGGTPGMKVSWQVTGIRHDPYAETNRVPVEEEKPAEERGTYLHPLAYGQPETMGLASREAQERAIHTPVPER